MAFLIFPRCRALPWWRIFVLTVRRFFAGRAFFLLLLLPLFIPLLFLVIGLLYHWSAKKICELRLGLGRFRLHLVSRRFRSLLLLRLFPFSLSVPVFVPL